MMDRIEYEEWALKAIDPALAPKLGRSAARKAPAQEGDSAVAKGQQPRETVSAQSARGKAWELTVGTAGRAALSAKSAERRGIAQFAQDSAGAPGTASPERNVEVPIVRGNDASLTRIAQY